MKNLFLRFCRWALPILGISATVSCDNVINTPDMYGCPPAEYGTPTMEFRVSGKVTDSATGNPIKGISVTCDDVWEDPEVITSKTGEFVYESTGFPEDKVKLKFTDIDYQNDGSYIPSELEVELTKVKDGSGTWDFGLYIADDVMVSLSEDSVVAEYGVPLVSFSVKGRVVDADANPIPNIEVTWGDMYGKEVTAEDGTFHYKNEEIGFEINNAVLTFTDIDGEENGGEFKTEEVDIPLSQSVPGDNYWNNGEFSATDVEIVLEKI